MCVLLGTSQVLTYSYLSFLPTHIHTHRAGLPGEAWKVFETARSVAANHHHHHHDAIITSSSPTQSNSKNTTTTPLSSSSPTSTSTTPSRHQSRQQQQANNQPTQSTTGSSSSRLDLKTYTAGLSALAKEGRATEAKALINEMMATGIISLTPDSVCHQLVMEACCRAGRWTEALSILRGPLR